MQSNFLPSKQHEAYYSMHRSLPSIPALRQMKPVNATPPSFLKAHFNIILLLPFHFHIYCGGRAIVLHKFKISDNYFSSVWYVHTCATGLYYFRNCMALESMKLCPFLLDSNCHMLLFICAWKLQMHIQLYGAVLWYVIVGFRILIYIFPILRWVSFVAL
jgi:hypothetical protein